MRILAVLLLMAVTAMFYVGFISYSGPSNTPTLNGHDFGDVLPNQELTHTFTLKRRWFRRTNITRVTPSCGCLITVLHPTNWGWLLKVGLRTDMVVGKKSVSVLVETDDPSRPRYRFELECSVTNPVSVTPLPIDFGVIDSSTEFAKSLPLTVKNNTPRLPTMEIIDPTEPSPVTIRDTNLDSVFSLSLQTPMILGPISAKLRIFYNDARSGFHDIPIRGVIMGPIQATPFEIRAIWNSTQEPFTAATVVSRSNPEIGLGMHVDSLQGDLSNPDDLEVNLIDMGDAARLEIKLKPGNRWTKGTQCRGSVLLVSSEGLRIVIPVNITVAPF